MKTYKASDLFDIQKSGTFPLDCEFVPKQNNDAILDLPGIYMLFFDQQIIYIGIAEKEPFIERLKKQLSTITLRGTSVCFNVACREIIESSKVLSQSFSKAVSQNNMRFETSKKRIAFAEKNWDVFSKLKQDDLSRFVVVWFPKNECLDKPLEEMKSQWIKTLKPSCNK